MLVSQPGLQCGGGLACITQLLILREFQKTSDLNADLSVESTLSEPLNYVQKPLSLNRYHPIPHQDPRLPKA